MFYRCKTLRDVKIIISIQFNSHHTIYAIILLLFILGRKNFMDMAKKISKIIFGKHLNYYFLL